MDWIEIKAENPLNDLSCYSPKSVNGLALTILTFFISPMSERGPSKTTILSQGVRPVSWSMALGSWEFS